MPPAEEGPRLRVFNLHPLSARPHRAEIGRRRRNRTHQPDDRAARARHLQPRHVRTGADWRGAGISARCRCAGAAARQGPRRPDLASSRQCGPARRPHLAAMPAGELTKTLAAEAQAEPRRFAGGGKRGGTRRTNNIFSTVAIHTRRPVRAILDRFTMSKARPLCLRSLPNGRAAEATRTATSGLSRRKKSSGQSVSPTRRS
jgi:hypothetical protein